MLRTSLWDTRSRAVSTDAATFDHDAPEIKETLDLETKKDVPMQVYLRTGLQSNILPAPAVLEPDPYIEITCDIDDVPAGTSQIVLDLPMTYSFMTEEKVHEMSCVSHIGSLNLGIAMGEISTNSSFDFRPEGSVDVKALDFNGTPDNEFDDLPDAFSFIAVNLACFASLTCVNLGGRSFGND